MKLEFEVGVGEKQVRSMLSRQLWRCLAYHYRKGHKLRLRVDDVCKLVECKWCGVPLVQGPDQVIDEVTSFMVKCGMEFEVLCETNILPVK